MKKRKRKNLGPLLPCPLCGGRRLPRDVAQHFQSKHGVAISQGEAAALRHRSGEIRAKVVRRLQARIMEKEQRSNSERKARLPSNGNLNTTEAFQHATQVAVNTLAHEGAMDRLLKGISAHADKLDQLIKEKWRLIEGLSGHIGLDPDRVYRIHLEGRQLSELGLSELRFQPGILTPPAIAIDAVLPNQSVIPLRFRVGQQVAVADEARLSIPRTVKLLLSLLCIFHYIDLIIPIADVGGAQATPQPVSAARVLVQPTQPARDNTKTRTMPRRPGTRSTTSSGGQTDSTQSSSAASPVDAFRRRLPAGQTPSLGKVLEADSFGIDLAGPGYPAVKYTWVRPHTRGATGQAMEVVYKDYRALRVLDTLLETLRSPATDLAADS